MSCTPRPRRWLHVRRWLKPDAEARTLASAFAVVLVALGGCGGKGIEERLAEKIGASSCRFAADEAGSPEGGRRLWTFDCFDVPGFDGGEAACFTTEPEFVEAGQDFEPQALYEGPCT